MTKCLQTDVTAGSYRVVRAAAVVMLLSKFAT